MLDFKNHAERADHWNAHAAVLEGATIKHARYIWNDDAERYELTLLLTLADGSRATAYVLSDDEGNNAGALHLLTPEAEPSYTILPRL